MKLFLSNTEESYRDMTDGHADALMGFTWGLAGVYASNDAKLKKTITKYYKAWFNMARCHGSDSYVILPGRDYADTAYYRDNIRNHTTAAMAFIYSFSTPKLRIQGGSGKDGKSGKTAQTGRLPQTPVGELRSFSNADRSKTIEAGLVAFDPMVGVVRVRLKNGETRDLPFLSLSKEDQDYVKKQSAGDADEPEP